MLSYASFVDKFSSALHKISHVCPPANPGHHLSVLQTDSPAFIVWNTGLHPCDSMITGYHFGYLCQPAEKVNQRQARKPSRALDQRKRGKEIVDHHGERDKGHPDILVSRMIARQKTNDAACRSTN